MPQNNTDSIEFYQAAYKIFPEIICNLEPRSVSGFIAVLLLKAAYISSIWAISI